MTVPKRILIAERDREALGQLSSVLRSSGYATWEAATGRDALRHVQMETPDLVLVGLVLPDIGGKDLARILSSNGDSEPIRTIVVAAPGVSFEESRAIGGAPEMKVFHWKHVDEVVTLVNGVFDVSEDEDPDRFSETLRLRDVTIEPSSMTVEVCGTQIELTQKEFKFLHVLALNSERTCTRDELRRLVWGQGAEVIGRTIDVLVSRLRSKLIAVTERDLISTVRGIGYRFTPGSGGPEA